MGLNGHLVEVSGFVIAAGGALACAYIPTAYPGFAKEGVWGGVALIAVGVSMLGWAFWREKGNVMADETKPIIGTDIANSGGGVGLDIESTGTNSAPSIGGESIVHARAGQGAIGTRVVQSGSGTGMRVVQTGSGAGYRSVVIGGEPESKK